MPEPQTPSLRKVAWSEILPWLILVRCFRIAIQFRLLACGAVGVLLMLTGWTILGYVFSGNEAIRPDTEAVLVCPWVQPGDLIGNTPGHGTLNMGVPPGDVSSVLPAPGQSGYAYPRGGRDAFVFAGEYDAAHPYWGIWEHISAPWRNLFDPRVSAKTLTDRLTRFVFLLCCGLWAVAVWALLAGVITRAAAIELATHDRAKTVRTIRYAASKWRAYFAAPALPLTGIVLLGVPIALVGLLLRTDITGWMAAIVWPFLLVDGFLMALLALGLLFGWPLMWANISVEGVDSFDAVGRAYSYAFQRPLQYLFYVLIAALLGALGWLLVWNFVGAVVGFTHGAAAWGAGSSRMEALAGQPAPADLGALDVFTAWLIAFWVGALKLLGVGFLYSYFWTASTAVYFLLRHDADATEMDEVCPEEEEQPPQAVPPARTGEPKAPASEGSLPTDQAE